MGFRIAVAHEADGNLLGSINRMLDRAGSAGINIPFVQLMLAVAVQTGLPSANGDIADLFVDC